MANRVTSATGSKWTVTTYYAGNVLYASHGAIRQMSYANQLVQATAFNNRLKPTLIQAQRGGLLLGLTYDYGTTNNNGNLLSQQISVPGMTTVKQAYDYDPLNRLLVASENPSVTSTAPICPDTASQWCQKFAYDDFGNRSIAASTNIGFSPGTPSSFKANNQVNGPGYWHYDPAGNQDVDGQGASYAYDAENRLVSANVPLKGTATYSYDGDGRRVKKVSTTGTTGTTVFVYDAMGQLAAEYSSIAPTTGGTEYLSTDHLGSTRMVTDSTGTVLQRLDYRPFGEEIPVGTSSPRYTVPAYAANADVRQKFTGKERDSESGLDYFGARFFSSAQGRFISADEFTGGPLDALGGGTALPGPLPYADILNPQSLNKYTYAYNNPLRYVDPDGHNVETLLEEITDVAVNRIANRVMVTRAATAGLVVGNLILAGTVLGETLFTIKANKADQEGLRQQDKLIHEENTRLQDEQKSAPVPEASASGAGRKGGRRKSSAQIRKEWEGGHRETVASGH